MRKVLLLGASGFIGAAIAQTLRGQSDVALTAFSSVDCDLCDASLTRATLGPLAADAVVIFAAGIPRFRADTLKAMTANIAMVHHVAEALTDRAPHQVIFLSSVEVYGAPVALPVTEATPLRPDTLYGAGKVAAELVLGRWCRRAGVPLTVLRLPGIYGPADGGRSVVGMMLRCIREGRPFNLVGGGCEERDYVFVHDVAEIVERLLQIGASDVVMNVATGRSETIDTLYRQVVRLCGAGTACHVPAASAPCHLRFDVSVRDRVLPGLRLHDVASGVQEMLKLEGRRL